MVKSEKDPFKEDEEIAQDGQNLIKNAEPSDSNSKGEDDYD
jgi:hypothetical protein